MDLSSPSSIEDWLSLPELRPPHVASAIDKGSIYQVDAVGLLVVTVKSCKRKRVRPVMVTNGKCLLPTAEIKFGDETQHCRLPPDFSNWVVECMALNREGLNRLPGKVEFGILNGHAFGEFR